MADPVAFQRTTRWDPTPEATKMNTRTEPRTPTAVERGRRTVPAPLVLGALGVAAAVALAARTGRGCSFDPLDPETWPTDTLAYSG
jgi:hypothetical protein